MTPSDLKMADRGVADGGLWNLPRTTISNDTKNLIQSMLAYKLINSLAGKISETTRWDVHYRCTANYCHSTTAICANFLARSYSA